MKPLLFLFRVAFCLAAALGVAAAEDAKSGVGERMFVIGASASAGFIQEELLGGMKTPEYRLKYYLDAALSTPHEPAGSSCTSMFFLAVQPSAKTQIASAVAAKPTLTVSVDFLFWFCYGRLKEEPARLALLEKGLAHLEKIPGTIVVGDLPDATSAIGKILDREEVPKVETIAAANRRIREWAAARPSVIVLPLSEFMATCKADKAVKCGPVEWPDGKTRALLQADELHASQSGNAALALSVFAALTERGLVPKESVLWDAEAVKAKAIANSQPEKDALKARIETKEVVPLIESK